MINSPLIQHDYTRNAMAMRDVLSVKRWSIFGALMVLLLGMLAGSPLVFAQQDASPPAAAASATAATPVNINTADVQTLAASLNGVGESRATDIVAYREAYGPFASVDELMEVKGIGQSTLDKNRAVITLE